MILFITSKFDPHVDYLIESIKSPFYRFNVDDYLNFNELNYKITNDNINISIIDKIGTKCDMSQIKSIYYRRPTLPEVIDNIDNIEIKQLVESETKEFLRQFYFSFLDVKWLCAPFKTNIAKGRVNQLIQASKIGFHIPKTLITSNKKEFFTFFNECHNKVIIKTINPFSHKINNNEKEYFYTEVIDNNNVQNIDFSLLRNSPTLFQEYITPEYELRITSIDSQHFPVKITSNITDWRKRNAIVEYQQYPLPENISLLLSKFLNFYNLEFGCFDIIKGINGNYYFLELNPNGQWLWLEAETGIPISKAILNYLET